MYTIYALEDQRYSEAASVRYVGLTKDVYSRFAQHVQCSGRNQEKNAWIQELKSENIMLIMRSIETVETLEEARRREEYWMQHYSSMGARLLNQYLPTLFSYEDFLVAFGKSRRFAGTSFTTNTKRKGPYAITKEAAADLLKCPISEINRGISEGQIKAFAKDETKVLRSSLDGFVPQKRTRKVKVAQ